jgi:signal transduction histidine kinase
MPDTYHLPALILTVLLLPAFFHLYWRSRDLRPLLWFLGFLFAAFRLLQNYTLGWWDGSDALAHPWFAAAGQAAAQISAALLLASFSPRKFRLGRMRILYAIAFAIPLVIYAILLFGVYGGGLPVGLPFLIFPVLGALSLFVGCFWGYSRANMPTWLGLGLCIVLGGAGLWICVTLGRDWPLVFVECALHATTAMLVFYAFRRFSLGTLLTGLGFVAWSLGIAQALPVVVANPGLHVNLVRIDLMGSVVAALGLILLALEDELEIKRDAEEREHRARKELEAYTFLTLSRRRVEEFDQQATQICESVVTNSRFSGVTLILLHGSGSFRVAGSAGLDEATANALEALVARIPVAGFLAPGSGTPAVQHSQTLVLDLEPWLLPGDDLIRLGLTTVLATPLYGRSATEGVLFLTGDREPDVPIRADDLFPVEMLAARIQSARSQTIMLEKLIDAEKFAGLGQMANNVTRQLNNPLTVILGYASLLEETEELHPQAQRAVEAILTEARHMRSTLESLSRMSRSQSEHLAAISITELLTDMEQLHRSEFVHRSIDFRLQIAPSLPRVLGNPQQVRQALLYCLHYAMDAVEKQDAAGEKTVRMEAIAEEGRVKIVISHTGQGFLHPARAFDPFIPTQAEGETSGLGLNLCATILRDNNGRASAVNCEPRGAAIILELQAA